MSKDDLKEVKAWVESFRPVRQRTVRDETTKDKAGTLPVCLYKNQLVQGRVYDSFNLSSDEVEVEVNIESTRDSFEFPEEYDSDSDGSESGEDPGAAEVPYTRHAMTRSGRVVRAAVKLDL